MNLPLKLAIVGLLSCGFFLGIYTIIASSSSLPFEDTWQNFFPGLDTGNFSQVHFNYGGNDFAGVIFRLSGQQLSTPQLISSPADPSHSLSCTYQLRGLYYNNMRGRRLRPLDSTSYATLVNQAGYGALTMTGGFFTHCTGFSYSPQLNDIYGEVQHTLSGITYHLVAGLRYNTVTNTVYNGSAFTGNFQLLTGHYAGLIFDSYGGIADVSSGSASIQICGNGIKEGSEQCDDGNAVNNDGCSNNCMAEIISGSLCTNAFTVSQPSDTFSPITFSLSGVWGSGVSIIGLDGTFNLNFSSTLTYSVPLGLSQTGAYTGNIIFQNNSIPTLTGSCPWTLSLLTGTNSCSFSASTGVALTGQDLIFSCGGGGATGYILNIYSGTIGGTLITHQLVSTGASHVSWTTGSFLDLGNYTAACVILTGSSPTGPQCGNQRPFIVTGHNAIVIPPPASCTDTFTKTITLIGTFVSGSNAYYTTQSGLILKINTAAGINYRITGDVMPLPFVGTGIGSDQTFSSLSLTNLNAFNYLYSSFASGTCMYTGPQVALYLDTLPPARPTLLTPTNTTNMCNALPLTLQWTSTPDNGSGVGLSGYQYTLQNTNGTTITATVGSGTTGVVLTGLSVGSYVWTVTAFDSLGNQMASFPGSFVMSTSTCTGQALQLSGVLTPVVDADTDTDYSSPSFSILGLTGPTLLTLTTGTLLVNTTGATLTGRVQSGDLLRISLHSSLSYDTQLQSVFSIGSLTGSFSVTTLPESSCSLSSSQRSAASSIYESLKAMYTDDPTKTDQFFSTMRSMIEDSVGTQDNCTLDYMLTLLDEEPAQQDTSTHITPSCKEYSISYDTNEYTSPDMKTAIYFINRESLIRYLDVLNPGDCHQPSYEQNTRNVGDSDTRHIAPNGKVYHITSSEGSYTSSDFRGSKIFSDLTVMKNYIDAHNPTITLWDHTVDTSFTPITYLTANDKSYTIYKTDKGYMSYKLLKVRYFSTLAEIESYINKNNKAK